MNNTLAIFFRFFYLFFVSMCDRPSESSSDDLKMHCLLFSFSPMLRTNSQQLNLHRHIYLSCKAQRNPALQYNIDCEIYQYLYLQGDYIKEPQWAKLYILWKPNSSDDKLVLIAYFDPKNYTLKLNMQFFILINFLVQTLQCTETTLKSRLL